MSAGLALAILFCTTVIGCSLAAYFFVRMQRMQAKLIESDDLATDRGSKVQYLQMQIEFMKRLQR